MPSATTSSLPLSPAELSYLHTSLSTNPPIRPDGRKPTDFRPLQAETNILPATNGSAHVSFSDGSEAIVGIKLEVERTTPSQQAQPQPRNNGNDVHLDTPLQGNPDWITLTLTTPATRDDDNTLIYISELLREPFLLPSTTSSPSLADALIINTRFHWHIYLDIILISPHPLSSLPLPLLSMATHLALRDTRVPRLKSEGEEDPSADDDWEASRYLYPRSNSSISTVAGMDRAGPGTASRLSIPPVTLLVVTVGTNILFDPSHAEIRVADCVLALSIAPAASGDEYEMPSLRTIDTPARDTMKGIPKGASAAGGVNGVTATATTTTTTTATAGVTGMSGDTGTGVWTPRVGGIKRALLKTAVSTVLDGGVARDVFGGLDGFLRAEDGGS
jgi:exosome complex component RRP42